MLTVGQRPFDIANILASTFDWEAILSASWSRGGPTPPTPTHTARNSTPSPPFADTGPIAELQGDGARHQPNDFKQLRAGT